MFCRRKNVIVIIMHCTQNCGATGQKNNISTKINWGKKLVRQRMKTWSKMNQNRKQSLITFSLSNMRIEINSQPIRAVCCQHEWTVQHNKLPDGVCFAQKSFSMILQIRPQVEAESVQTAWGTTSGRRFSVDDTVDPPEWNLGSHYVLDANAQQ